MKLTATLAFDEQRIYELDDADFDDLLELVVEEADRRGWIEDGGWMLGAAA